jgi:hypothetical protein
MSSQPESVPVGNSSILYFTKTYSGPDVNR